MRFLKYSALTVALLGCTVANAAIISSYNKATAAADGWSVVYQGGYNTEFDYQEVLDNIAAGSTVALASSSSSTAPTFELFAGTALTVLETLTAINATIFADDAYWYRNGNSTGFSPQSDITQCSADGTNSVCGSFGASTQSELRLSWHGGTPTIFTGFRSGDNTFLQENTAYQRYVLVRDGQAVPEPASIALLGLGILGLAATRRRSKVKQ